MPHLEQRVELGADGRLAARAQLRRRQPRRRPRAQHQEQVQLVGAAAGRGAGHRRRLQHPLHPLHARALQLHWGGGEWHARHLFGKAL